MLVLPALGCGSRATPTALDRLRPCASDEGPPDSYCGTLRVFENRDARQGRTIDLNIVVLPALGNDAAPDPLFFLAGGPGQGAAQMARQLRELFRRVQARRDIVLVDQRGTGDSHPLNCHVVDDSLAALNEPRERWLARLRDCLAQLDADPRFYTTTIAMDDLDDVRRYLGYERINLYGGSYGTRAALTYLRQHEAAVRSVVLDGVAPADMRLPLFFGRDAERAFNRLAADCEIDPACASRHPNLSERLRTLLGALDKAPVTVRLTHPRTGVAEQVRVDGEFVANVIFGALYNPLTSSMLPELIARAEQHDFQALLALALLNEESGGNMSLGMQLSVVCAEDYPRISPDQIARAEGATLFGRHLLAGRLDACEFWPRGHVDPSYYEPVVSDVPVLVLSGDLDPVTPPQWGESILPHLSNAHHVIVPATGHGTIGTACGMRIIHAFVESAAFDELDTSCADLLKRPPFFLSPAGPDPAGVPGTPR